MDVVKVVRAVTVGDLLHKVLSGQGMTQVQLSELTGISQKHLSQIRGDKSRLSVEYAVLIEKATGVPAEVWLMTQVAADLAIIRGVDR